MVDLRRGFRFEGSDGGGGSGTGGRGCGVAFFGVFLVMGLVFTVALTWAVVRNAMVYTWDATPATIVSSELITRFDDDDAPFEAVVEYEYDAGGARHRSRRVMLDGATFDDVGKAQELLARYGEGKAARAYVNPRSPDESVLARPALWMGLFIFLPLIFVAVGAGGMVASLRRGKGLARSSVSSEKAEGAQNSRKVMLVMGLAFLALGLPMSWLFGVRPVMGVLAAKSWPAVTATVIDGTVRSHDSDDGTTYSVDILYEFEYQGERYLSNRYDFSSGSSSGYSGKAAIVGAHPKGAKVTAYVNPSRPTQAVLSRGMSWWLLLGLIPLAFALAGVALMIGGLRQRGGAGERRGSRGGLFAGSLFSRRRGLAASARAAATTADWLPDLKLEDPDGPVTLKPASSRGAKFAGLLVFSLIWNGFTWPFFIMTLREALAGAGFAWVPVVFLSIFIVVGLVLLGAVVHQGLAMFNPRPMLTVSQARLPVGSVLDVAWDMVGRSGRIERLRIVLEGREEARYRRGTDTVIDHATFFEDDLASTDDPLQIAHGSGSITIPPDTMHSIELTNNKVQWRLLVKGEIPRWPDVDDEFQIVVVPAAADAGESI